MVTGHPLLNIPIEVAGIALSILGILQAAEFRRAIDRKTRMVFYAFFAFLALDLSAMICVDAIGESLRGGAEYAGWLKLCYFCHYLFSPLMGCTATVYLFGLLGYARKGSFLWITFLSAAGVYFSLLVLTLFNGLYWTVDAAGVYRRGSGYWISILFSVLPLLLNMGSASERAAEPS